MNYFHREIQDILEQAVSEVPAIVLTGPRQSGKTTLLRHMFSNTHNCVTLYNADTRLMAKTDPGLFVKNYPPPCIIDEVQYAPELFSYLKIEIDNNREQKGQFLLTGSQSFPLMSKAGESLAGRIAVLTLLSLSIREKLPFLKNLSFSSLKQEIMCGGFPEISLDKTRNKRLWFSSYLQTYLERDIRNLRQIGDLSDF